MTPISQANAPYLTLVSSLDSAPAPTQVSGQIDPIEFLRSITASLELDAVLAALDRFLVQLVGHSSWRYRNPTAEIVREGGAIDRHQIDYAVRLDDAELGTLTLSRGRRFSVHEQSRIEALLGLAAPALDHALRYRELIAQIERDPLTGLSNRLALEREGAHWLADAARHHHPLSMLALDLDGFKGVNDQFGHPEGDRLLQDVADALRSATRAGDLCVRMGGDEFAVLLPHADLSAAMECAERIREAVANRSISSDNGMRIGVSVSVGVAAYRPGMTLEQLYGQADAALYAAKRAGRNRTLAGACNSIHERIASIF